MDAQPIVPAISPLTIRPRIFLEAASEMMDSDDWPYREVRVEMRSRGGETGVFRLFGANHPDSLQEMAAGTLDIAILNPSALLTMAYKGTGAFHQPIPVSTIAMIPHHDQLGFAVTEASGLQSLDQIREQRYPLRVSVRGSLDACTTLLVDVVLKAHGFSLEDIVSWGGHVSYDQPMPDDPSRIGRVQNKELDAIFDEGIMVWGHLVHDAGMHFLPIDEQHLTALEAQGFRRATISKRLYPPLSMDVPAVDFSGWPIFARREASDLLIRQFCEALEARKQQIPWNLGMGSHEQPPMPLDHMCRDTPVTPIDVPFHPAAERFWREKGYL
ncbi:hypothetical protein KDA_50090 [Dictyobacter alpinus]|uniref:SsuA/THI5-like domain-containing protein n=1 Tax=Dictyobacter alpinus TaxID=2014873 RepID=A0A402BDT9_9CHLR|nr:TAXI family TRAP transporter solute-binding subunit [Dictyobacter alpinus]GCE29525.1 hypothetical protein KDA_50090 [Dictyobacter alpinus]